MKDNKELVLDLYEQIVEARYPQKGQIARRIIEAGWDKDADRFVDQGRLSSMGYKVDNGLAINTAKGIVTRHPELNEQLKALK